MADNAVPEIFADGLMNVTFNNGVIRLTLGQLDANNRAVPVARLLVPGNQMQTLINVLTSTNQQIVKELQERAQAAQTEAETQGENSKKKKAGDK